MPTDNWKEEFNIIFLELIRKHFGRARFEGDQQLLRDELKVFVESLLTAQRTDLHGQTIEMKPTEKEITYVNRFTIKILEEFFKSLLPIQKQEILDTLKKHDDIIESYIQPYVEKKLLDQRIELIEKVEKLGDWGTIEDIPTLRKSDVLDLLSSKQ